MNMHRKTKLMLYHQEKVTITDLAKRFMVSRSTIYVVLLQILTWCCD
ncbi:helix-turn-helix domain-containing protein [Commensalibacter nepenthis]